MTKSDRRMTLQSMAAGPGIAGAGGQGMSRLEVQRLRVTLGRSGPPVVSEVDFALAAGEVLGLVGESGSGKTTVGLAMLGRARRGLSITDGQVRLNGVDVLRLTASELRAIRGSKVAYVPQDPGAALNPALRIRTQLVEVLDRHMPDDTDINGRVVAVLEEAGLDATTLERYPHQLSGGQQQRVTIAIAFCCRPSLIVLDEPTTGLDVTVQGRVLDSIRDLCAAYGVAALYISHDLAVVGSIATRVAVMYGGKIIEQGAALHVLNSPRHPYTAGLLAAVPTLRRAEALHGIEGTPPRPGNRPQGCSFHPRCLYAVTRCRTEIPEQRQVGNQMVRCHRADELDLVGAHREALGHSNRSGIREAAAPALSLSGVNAWYASLQVLRDITLAVPAETCTALVGESGSGKTTIARCIAGLHSRWDGEIQLDGARLERSAQRRQKEMLRRVQYVFQNPYMSLNPRKTVGQILAQPLEQLFDLSFPERMRRVAAALSDVSLGTDSISRYPDQLSGGERQRVAIARALVAEPEILICDEVTSALDVSVQAVIVELLRRLQVDRHLTMVFITHNLHLVRSIAQEVAVLKDGVIVEAGRVEEVIEHAQSDYTIALIKNAPDLAAIGSGSS